MGGKGRILVPPRRSSRRRLNLHASMMPPMPPYTFAVRWCAAALKAAALFSAIVHGSFLGLVAPLGTVCRVPVRRGFHLFTGLAVSRFLHEGDRHEVCAFIQQCGVSFMSVSSFHGVVGHCWPLLVRFLRCPSNDGILHTAELYWGIQSKRFYRTNLAATKSGGNCAKNYQKNLHYVKWKIFYVKKLHVKR